MHIGGVIYAPILRILNEKAILSLALRETSKEGILNTARSLREQFNETPANGTLTFSEPGRSKKLFYRVLRNSAFTYFGPAYAVQ